MSYIEKVLALSTEHMPSESPDFGDFRALEHEHGYVVFCFELLGMEDLHIPAWIEPIMKQANTDECTLILFDADCNVDPDFPTYEWGESQ
tara:strand:- start:381 stop:650 length:270 start_codon:yes stop_codon:yes gene_type:complete